MKRDRSEICVVAAVVRTPDAVLLARRKEGTLAGYWEFPGGKVEPGETPQQALVREVQEELGVGSTVGELFGESEHLSLKGVVRLSFYRCRLQGEPTSGPAHDALAWVPVRELLKYRVAPADVPIVRKLMEEKYEEA